MEIINSAQITPKRLITLIKVVEKMGEISRQDLLDLLQPLALPMVNNQQASELVYRAAIRLELIRETGVKKKVASIHPSIKNFGDLCEIESFRSIFQSKLLGVTNESEDEYLLNLVTAWYAVKGYSLVGHKKSEVAIDFNQEMSSKDPEDLLQEGADFNPTKLGAWMTWASFLGFGWEYNGQFIQDSHIRILPIINDNKGNELSMSEFMQKISSRFPELDKGYLFEFCKQELNLANIMDNNISLMLSTGLRTLHDRKAIELIKRPDSTDVWWLHEASGHLLNSVSHVRILG